ncbi:MAG TPA: dihydroorotate dehydrogenase electron transfer subunit [Tissierellales bacterium]|nr:dihydroorotate dehydrogenase electron transfer subunit [Tissierellales bacterium]
MQLNYKKGEVLLNEEIAKKIFKIKVKGNFNGNPGQFYMLRAWDREPFLSRPLSIYNLSNKYIEFLYEVKGRGTKIFSNLKSGDFLYLLGPLGNGFNLDIHGRVGIIAGGIGIAPMIYLANKLGKQVDFYAGFREEPYSIEEIKYKVNKLYIATENGCVDHKGYVVDMLNVEKYSQILACGPTPMLKKIVSICEENHVPAYISMENIMGCGIGSCLGCTIETVNGMKKVCKDGPIFPGEEIVFND